MDGSTAAYKQVMTFQEHIDKQKQDIEDLLAILKNLEDMLGDLEGFQQLLAQWTSKTFPDSIPEKTLSHLMDEVNHELYFAVYSFINTGGHEQSKNALAGEIADVILLSLSLATLAKINIKEAVRYKYLRNLNRTWTYNPSKGYMEGSPE